MNKSLKATLATLSIAAATAGFTSNAGAQALPPPPCAGCSDWVLSPDAGTLAFGGLVSITGNELNITPTGGTQAPGLYGAGFKVAGGGTLEFDADLHSWDAYAFDHFTVTMSTAGYFWNTGVGPVSWTWGGNSYTDGILEHYKTIVNNGMDTLSLTSNGMVYVSVVMQSTVDSSLPTWGSFHVDMTTAPIPEPETYAMLLAGLGLMGFVARRRQRKLVVA